MNTNDPNVLKALRSKHLLQFEIFDSPSQTDNPKERNKIIVFILRDRKAAGGVSFVVSPVNIRYNDRTDCKAEGLRYVPMCLESLDVHFIVKVLIRDNYMWTFLKKIKKDSEVFFTITVNMQDWVMKESGLINHQLMATINYDSYLLASWVGKWNQNPPVKQQSIKTLG